MTRRIAVAAQAALDLPGRLSLVFDGYNTTYQIRGTERFALRVTRPGPTLEHVRGELAWMNALAEDTSVRLCAPVGHVVVEDRVCVATRWVNGAQRSAGLTPNMLRAVGRTMRTLHEHASTWTPPKTFVRETLDQVWLDGPSPIPSLDPERADLFQRAHDRVERVVLDLVADGVRVIHADLHQSNVRFGPGHDVGVLDFDDVSWGHPIQDLAITIYYLSPLRRYAELRAAVIEGTGYDVDPDVIDALLVWRTLGLFSAVRAHPNPFLSAKLDELLPRWTDRVRTFLGQRPA